MRNLISTTGLREKYGVSRQAIHQWRLMGLPCVQLDARTTLYDEHETHQWLIQNRGARKNRGVIK